MAMQLHDAQAQNPRIFRKPGAADQQCPLPLQLNNAQTYALASAPPRAAHLITQISDKQELGATALKSAAPSDAVGETPAARGRIPLFWPPEAKFILSALDAGRTRRQEVSERRGANRRAWQTVATLRLFSDAAGAAPWVIYTRDATDRSLGFITRHRLPLGYAGTLRLIDPAGNDLAIECIIHRCRESVLGWFEGAMHFNRCQTDLVELIGRQS